MIISITKSLQMNSYLKVGMQLSIKNFAASVNILQLIGLKVVGANPPRVTAIDPYTVCEILSNTNFATFLNKWEDVVALSGYSPQFGFKLRLISRILKKLS